MRKLIVAALLALPSVAHTQSVPPLVATTVTFQGTAADASGAALAYAQVNVTLAYCQGNQPRFFYNGVATSLGIGISNYRITADANGVFTTTLVPNDAISCNGNAGGTRWRVSYLDDGVPTGNVEEFFVPSSINPFDIGQQAPATGAPPVGVTSSTYAAHSVTAAGLDPGATINLSQVNGAGNLIATTPAGNQTITQPNGTSLSIAGVLNANAFYVQTDDGVLNLDQFPGSDACTQLQNALATLPGYTITASGVDGSQVTTANVSSIRVHAAPGKSYTCAEPVFIPSPISSGNYGGMVMFDGSGSIWTFSSTGDGFYFNNGGRAATPLPALLFQGFVLAGPGASTSGGCGLHVRNAGGTHFIDNSVSGFAAGFCAEGFNTGFNEDVWVINNAFSGNGKAIQCYSNSAHPGSGSCMYWTVLGNHFNLGTGSTGQIGLSVEGVQMFGGYFDLQYNINNASGSTPLTSIISVSSGGQLQRVKVITRGEATGGAFDSCLITQDSTSVVNVPDETDLQLTIVPLCSAAPQDSWQQSRGSWMHFEGEFAGTQFRASKYNFSQPTNVGGGITTIVRASNVATVTTQFAHGLSTGANVNISKIWNGTSSFTAASGSGAYDNTFFAQDVDITVTGANTFTYPSAGSNETITCATTSGVCGTVQQFGYASFQFSGANNAGVQNFWQLEHRQTGTGDKESDIVGSSGSPNTNDVFWNVYGGLCLGGGCNDDVGNHLPHTGTTDFFDVMPAMPARLFGCLTVGTLSTSDWTTVTGGTQYCLDRTLTASISPASTAAGTCAVQKFTVTGLVTGDLVTALAPPSDPAAGVSIPNFYTDVSTGKLAMNICNAGATVATAPSGTYTLEAKH